MSDDLELLTRAERLLAEAEAPRDYASIVDMAEAARVFAERARLGTASVNHATSIKLQAMAGLARAVDAGQADGTIRGHGGDRSKTTGGTLADLGVTTKTVRESRLVALAADHHDLRDLAADATADDRDLTKAEVVAIGRRIESGIDPDRGDDWYTPTWLFDAIGLEFGADVCAPADPAHRTCPADTYYTETDDGLSRHWPGTVWCNPPYSLAAPWVARMIQHGDGVLLVHIPANATWAVDAWRTADAMVPLQAVEFTRPNGKTYRPGVALMLLGYGTQAAAGVTRAARVTAKAGDVWLRSPR